MNAPQSTDLGNQAAFATPSLYTAEYIERSGVIHGEPGLTKRELFAAMAMQGTLASIEDSDTWEPAGIASHAVACADALLTALKEMP